MDNQKEKKIEDLSFPDQKITEINVEHEVKKSFIEYAMSVIMSRALPDIRDGMKPGQRRILYAMYEDHLTHDKPFRKSATTVGNVLGRYHPHGDSAVYGTMVRMAQDFSMRHPLVEGHGNFGSVDGDAPAAYRYTEARLDKIADEMMRDLDKEVVEMVPNFDNRLREPSVLPARFPNFLVNGAVGIAVGMATNVPPHNLGEIIDATIYRMNHPDCTLDELMEFVKGPDFPTYGTIYGTRGIREAYATGAGRIYVRAKAEINEDKRQIIITEIPYMVNKALLCKNIAGLVKEKRIDGITDMRDESGRNGMRIVIEYRRDANGQVILNQLYKFTQLQDTCSINMLGLINNEPKILSLPQILDVYIAHQEDVIIRRTKFDLEKAKTRAHIFEGYHIALDNIDRIIEIMKTSPSIPEAKARLMSESFAYTGYGDGYVEHDVDPSLIGEGNTRHLSEAQAQAIVEMTLGRLTGMERGKIEEELKRLHALIMELEAILADTNKVKEIISNEMTEIKDKYADARRTRIEEAVEEISLEDLIEEHECVVTLSHSGYIKRLPADTYDAQHRGGKGITGVTTKEEDFIEKVLAVNSHSLLLMFTNTGKVQAIKAYRIPEAGRTAKGTNIVNVLTMEPGEKVTAVLNISGFSDDKFLLMVTKYGVIKRTPLSAFAYQRKGGKRALTLDEGDELLFVKVTDGSLNILIATRHGYAVRYDENLVRSMGRTARGVRGIRLTEDDYVIGVVPVEESKTVLTVTDNGFGKRSIFDDFRENKGRSSRGVRAQAISEKTGLLAGIVAVDEDEDIMVVTEGGVIIRVPVADIPCHNRSTMGVKIMRVGEDQKIAFVTQLAKKEETEDTGTFIDDETETEGTGSTPGAEAPLVEDFDQQEEDSFDANNEESDI